MFKQENSRLPPSITSESKSQANGKKRPMRLYAVLAGLAVIVVIVAALLIPQGAGSPMELSLNYAVGEHMAYDTINIVTNQIANTSLALAEVTNSQSFNSTLKIDVIGSNSENYTINETITSSSFSHLPN